MGKSKLDKIYDEVAYDTKLPKKLVRKAIKLLFKEIAITLLLKSKPIMIRRFIKIVLATRTSKKIIENYNKYKTKL
jgi:nucleoid DNA-binding protein